MIHILYIPVIFVCLNGECAFAQTAKHYVREVECMAAVAEQIRQVKMMAASAGQVITQLKGACVIAKDGML